MDTVEQYFDKNPKATIKEYLDYKRKQEKQRLENIHINEEKRKEYYKSLYGKYFMIDFNDDSIIFFQLSDLFGSNKFYAITSYEFVKSSNQFRVEKHRELNPIWFNNPYETNCYNQGMKCVELSEEQWDSVMGIFNKHIDNVCELKNVIKNI